MAIAGVDGLASGLKTTDIVNAMIEADRAATRVLEDKKTLYETRLQAVQMFNTKLLSAQIDLTSLRADSSYNARKGASSSESDVTVSASSSAIVGSTVIDITSIARSHQRTSAAQASNTADLGAGTVIIQLGNGAETTLTIGAGSGSLNSIAQKINEANLGVSASVINDGSTGSPYKLVLQSNSTGTANMIKVRGTAALDDLFLTRTENQADQTSDLGDGTITLQVGDGTETTLTFAGGGNSSLDDIVNAVNTASLGVTAAVVDDNGEKRIEFTPTVAGTGIAISGTGAMDDLFDGFANTISTAKDAKIKLGTGATAITITKSSNTITDAIAGVTLNLKDMATGVTVSVSSDTSGTRDLVQKFIDSLNDAITYYNQNSSYDTTTKQAGVLMSETGLRRGINDIVRAFDSPDADLPLSMNAISALGITIDRAKGTFSLDSKVFDSKLAADPAAVMKLFTNSATTTNTLVQFSSMSDATKVAKPYTVNITTAASQAFVGNTAVLAASTVITNANKSLNLTVNGKAYTATLATGTYSRSELATQVTNAINAAVPTNAQVTASLDNAGTGIELRSVGYGSSNKLKVTGGSANADLHFAATGTDGVDVAGTFTYDGVTTTGKGAGRLLTGANGSAAEGLYLTVTATAPTAGVTIDARKGIAQLTSEKFHAMTNADVGAAITKGDELQKSIDDMAAQIAKKDAFLAQRRERYLKRFQAMEQLISQFNAQGNAMAAFTNSLIRTR